MTVNHPKSIGRYEVLGILGRGGMGFVYEAFDPKLHRHVAIKTVLTQNTPREHAAELDARFLVEGRAAGRLHHPNVVAVHDADRDPALGAAYLVMELVRGEDLDRQLKRGERFGFRRTMSIARELLSALHYAHDQGVVHRDVKPGNILIDATGHVKLSDFGVSRVLDSGDATLTALGGLVGTLRYASPEQLRGEVVDSRADLWAAGVVLYQLLTATRPFDGKGDMSIILSVQNETPRPPSAFNPNCGQEMDAVMAKALAKSKQDRYANARDFWLDLQAAAHTALERVRDTNASPAAAPVQVSSPDSHAVAFAQDATAAALATTVDRADASSGSTFSDTGLGFSSSVQLPMPPLTERAGVSADLPYMAIDADETRVATPKEWSRSKVDAPLPEPVKVAVHAKPPTHVAPVAYGKGLMIVSAVAAALVAVVGGVYFVATSEPSAPVVSLAQAPPQVAPVPPPAAPVQMPPAAAPVQMPPVATDQAASVVASPPAVISEPARPPATRPPIAKTANAAPTARPPVPAERGVESVSPLDAARELESKDPRKAIAQYESLARGTSKEFASAAALRLIELYAAGSSTIARDYGRAVKWTQFAKERGWRVLPLPAPPGSEAVAAPIIESVNEERYSQARKLEYINTRQALDVYLELARAGHGPSQRRLWEIYSERGNSAEAAIWQKRAYESKVPGVDAPRAVN